MKKLLSLLLALSLTVSLCTLPAFAEEVPSSDELPASPPPVEEVLGGDLPAAPPTGDAAPDAGVDLPAVPPVDGAAPDIDMGVDPVAPDASNSSDGPESQEGQVELDENGQVPFDPDAPAIVIQPDNAQITEEILNRPASMPTEEMLPQVDGAMGVAPAAMPVVAAPEYWNPDESAFDYTHWVDSRFGNGLTGRLMGNEDGAWYTYCVDEHLVYPSEAIPNHDGILVPSQYVNVPLEEIPYSQSDLKNRDIRINTEKLHEFQYGHKLYRESGDAVPQQDRLAKVLEAGYPQNGVAAINAIADQLGYDDEEMAFFTQTAVWAVCEGSDITVQGELYSSSLYEYATAGTVGGVPITDPGKLVITDGVDSEGSVSLIYDEASHLWTGTITFNATPSDLVLAAVSEGVNVTTAGGTVLRAGDTVTDLSLVLTAASPDIRGAIQFSYNIRKTVDAKTLTLFESDITKLSMESIGADRFISANSYQRMLGYEVAEASDQLTALVLGVNQPAPEPEPTPEPTPEPEPPTPPTPPTPAPDVDDDDEGYDDDRPAPPADIPDEAPPLAELPGETPVPEAETPALEELTDPEVPLAQVPETGDAAWLFAAAAVLSGAGLLWLALSGRKRTHGE